MGAHHRTEASRLLGLSTGSLRRLSRAYEAAFQPLPTDGAGGRIYPDEVLDLFQDARELVKSRRVGTVEQAFKLLAEGAAPLATPQQVPQGELVTREDFAEAMRVLMKENAAIRAELARMHDLLEHVAAQLPTPAEEKPRPWWRMWG